MDLKIELDFPEEKPVYNSVSPHLFEPLRWWDRFVRNGRCRMCYFPRSGHPIRNFWAIARPWGDKARCTWGEAAQMELDAVVVTVDTEVER